MASKALEGILLLAFRPDVGARALQLGPRLLREGVPARHREVRLHHLTTATASEELSLAVGR